MSFSAERLSPAFRHGMAAELCFAAAAPLLRIRQAFRIRRTVRMLSALDNTVLSDIGLERSQILQAARRAGTPAGHRLSR